MPAFADAFGNALTLEHGASLQPVQDFIEGFAASEARVVRVLEVAEQDASPIVQALCAALHMFAEAPEAPAQARRFMQRALSSPIRPSPREASLVGAIGAWVSGDIDQAIARHEAHAQNHPRDLAALKLGQYHLFNRGDAVGMRRMMARTCGSADDLAYWHGMHAFALEQNHELEAALAAAHRAMALKRKEPWAHHAIAHVLLTRQLNGQGKAFMQGVSDTWTGLNSFMVSHNWWHLALFHIELGELDRALAIHDTHVWAHEKAYSQDQINAISLLSRLELAGADVGDRWLALAPYLASRTADHVLPFLDVQYLYGLARAGRPEADVLLDNIEHHARRQSGHQRAVWLDIALPTAMGLLAHARGDWATAAQALDSAWPRMQGIGGSHAQRDWFARVAAHAHRHLNTTAH